MNIETILNASQHSGRIFGRIIKAPQAIKDLEHTIEHAKKSPDDVDAQAVAEIASVALEAYQLLLPLKEKVDTLG